MLVFPRMKQGMNCHMPSKEGGRNSSKCSSSKPCSPYSYRYSSFMILAQDWVGLGSFLKVAKFMLLKRVGRVPFFIFFSLSCFHVIFFKHPL